MKKYITILIFAGSLANAQVSIGGTSISSPSVSLEFGEGNKGLILPYVTTGTTKADNNGAVPGTIFLDTTDKKVKVKYQSGWFDLTRNFDTPQNQPIDVSLQNNTDYPENTLAKVSIGKPKTPAVPGILVLEDDNKAMILPKVASPHLNIKNPAPGMMAYDTVTSQLCIYNGTVWSFWKP